MTAEHPTHRVEVTFVGTPPVRQIERASGVGEVEIDGPIVRCLVAGSFQPFLEALRGHEVIILQSRPTLEPSPLARVGRRSLMDFIAGASPRQLARIAGALYLINIGGGAFAIGIVPALVVVPGYAAATAHNIQTHELLYRLGLVAHVVVDVTNVSLAVIFYDLFKVVNRRLALRTEGSPCEPKARPAGGGLHPGRDRR